MDFDTLEERLHSKFGKFSIQEEEEEKAERPNLISELTEQWKLAYELRERDKRNEKKLTLERLKAYTSDYKDHLRNAQVQDICALLKSINVTHDEYVRIKKSLNKSYMENIEIPKEKVDNFLKEFHDHFGNNIDEFIKEDEMVM